MGVDSINPAAPTRPQEQELNCVMTNDGTGLEEAKNQMGKKVVRGPEVTLNSGQRMPLLATGTATYPFPPADDIKRAVLDAVEVGYRHFDTAALYQSEEGVGLAIAEAVEKKVIKNREEVFITTKLWCNNATPERVLPALRESLRSMIILIVCAAILQLGFFF